MTRLFVAAWPDTATIERLSALPRPDETGVRWVPDQNLHVTLRFLGEVDLAATIRSVTATIGDHDPRRFRGHVTVARTKRGVVSSLIGAPVGGVFDITELALVASDLRPTGVVYTTVATFPTLTIGDLPRVRSGVPTPHSPTRLV